MAAFASNPNPYYALGHALWGAGWWLVVIAIINSAIGVGLACTNAASRVLYTMGQAGTVPARFGRLHPRHQTPTFAIAFIQLSGIVAILLVGLLLAPADIFGFLGTITTLAVIVLYIMANLALTAYIRREHPGDYNVWRHGVLPWIGTLALLPVLFVTVYPRPAWPFNLTPYIFIAALGYWGSNIARGGFLAESAADLPAAAGDYVDKLVAPYFACACEWYETIGIGVTGGQLYDLVRRRLGDPFFGVQLNPGHFIHLDEWPSSPVWDGSEVVLRSGMTLQIDIIPATGTAYHTTNIEDGVALADEAARADLAARYPEAWARIARRREFMADRLGIRLRPEVLPLSDLAGYLPPYWLAPGLAMRKA